MAQHLLNLLRVPLGLDSERHRSVSEIVGTKSSGQSRARRRGLNITPGVPRLEFQVTVTGKVLSTALKAPPAEATMSKFVRTWVPLITTLNKRLPVDVK